MTPDAKGDVTLIDRDTGKPHVCTTITAKEILAVATPAVDGAPRYVPQEGYDGKPAKAKGAKAEQVSPPVPPVDPKAPELS